MKPELQKEMNELEVGIKSMENLKEARLTFHELSRDYDPHKIKEMNTMIRKDIALRGENFRYYIFELLVPTLRTAILELTGKRLLLSPTLEIQYRCDRCETALAPIESRQEKYTLEQRIFEDISRKGTDSPYFKSCDKCSVPKHPVPMDVAMVTNILNAQIERQDYPIESIRANTKHGQELAFKFIDRLSNPSNVQPIRAPYVDPIWDLFRVMIPTFPLEKSDFDILYHLYRYICFEMQNPHRQEFNRKMEVLLKSEAKKSGIPWKEMKDIFEEHWKLPNSSGRFFNSEGDLILDGSEQILEGIAEEETYKAQNIRDWFFCPVEIQLVPWNSYRENYEGPASHPNYKRKQIERAKKEWEPYQWGAYWFLIDTHLFDRSILHHP
ncbi:MAG: hypothetical protein V1743_05160 [Nanoarchaeota archaeon]